MFSSLLLSVRRRLPVFLLTTLVAPMARGQDLFPLALDPSVKALLEETLARNPDLQAARERIGQGWNQKNVRRSRQQEAPGLSIAVDRHLEGREQGRHPLDFIQNDLGRKSRNEAPGVQRRRVSFRSLEPQGAGICCLTKRERPI